MDKDAFVQGYLGMLTEAFEGPAGPRSAFLDPHAGLFETLAGISADQASTAHAPGGTTIASHTEHLRFHLAGLTAFLRGEGKPLDWAESWKIREVDETEWRRLQRELEQEYRSWREFAQTWEPWDEQAVGGAIAALAHVVYHLGAIRQKLAVGRLDIPQARH